MLIMYPNSEHPGERVFGELLRHAKRVVSLPATKLVHNEAEIQEKDHLFELSDESLRLRLDEKRRFNVIQCY